MKVWRGYGSEHSYRLVLVGHFADVQDAETVEEEFEKLQEIASDEVGTTDWDDPSPGFSEAMYERLRDVGAMHLSRTDVEGFGYIEGVYRSGKTVTFKTDDAELQGVLKLILDHGGRVEMYSSKYWTEDGQLIEHEETPDVAEHDGEVDEGGGGGGA